VPQTVDFKRLKALPAIESCSAAIKLDPQNARYAFQLGRAYDRAGENLAAYHAYLAASEKGSSSAMVNLGILFEKGQGVQRNGGMARDYYRRAAELDNAEGMFCFATALENGIGGRRNIIEAAKWYERAAKAGADKAVNALRKLEARGAPTGTRCD
jgi:tetratricopeptide (TPR) repeat protein